MRNLSEGGPRKKERRLRLGLLANELFDIDVGPMGDFGWAVQQVARCFAEDPSLGVDVVILMGEKPRRIAPLPAMLHGSRVLWRSESKWLHAKRLRAERLDLLLCIDYRPNYRLFYYALPEVPIIIWVRDPRNRQDLEEIATLRIPNQEGEKPQGTTSPITDNLKQVHWQSRLMRRPLVLAPTAGSLRPKFVEAYGFDPGRVDILPNIVPIPNLVQKAERPVIVFLGRLDPIKRPWLFAALAERFPAVEFVFMGQSHFSGPGAWTVRDLSVNVRLTGHIDGVEKLKLLSSAWLLVNTSIHESLPVSFLEALACETPIVACVDPDGIVSRYGAFAGTHLGTGMTAVPVLERLVRNLLNDTERRLRLGAEGRAWVSATHNRAQFLNAFFRLASLAGIDMQGTGGRPAVGGNGLKWVHCRLS